MDELNLVGSTVLAVSLTEILRRYIDPFVDEKKRDILYPLLCGLILAFQVFGPNFVPAGVAAQIAMFVKLFIGAVGMTRFANRVADRASPPKVGDEKTGQAVPVVASEVPPTDTRD